MVMLHQSYLESSQFVCKEKSGSRFCKQKKKKKKKITLRINLAIIISYSKMFAVNS